MFIVEKTEDKKIAFETFSGKIMILSSLQYAVAQNISLPMSAACPTSIRYELAKYEVSSIKKAYSEIYEVFGNLENIDSKEINESELFILSNEEKEKLLALANERLK